MLEVWEEEGMQEEVIHLDALEKDISREISRLEFRIQGLDLSSAVDYDDVERLKDERRRFKKYKDSICLLNIQAMEPYHGRIDMEDSETGELKQFYIGREDLTFNYTDQRVVDWRSPMGNIFSSKKKEFLFDGRIHRLILRRDITIKNKELKEINTSFDINNEILGSEVVDKFLLSVLKDKRRENRLTDIIQTVNATQNEIMRRPFEENFIVQGCAGSGKTMVLLHRLSVLSFENQYLDIEKIRVITPNPNFSLFIDELSTDLKIGLIKKQSVEEYYMDLVKRFHSSWKPSGSLRTETLLDTEVLEYIYSIDFQNMISNELRKKWKKSINILTKCGFPEIVKNSGLAYPDISEPGYKSFAMLQNMITALNVQKQKHQQNAEKLGIELKAKERQFAVIQFVEVILRKKLQNQITGLHRFIEDTLAKKTVERRTISIQYPDLHRIISKIKKDIEEEKERLNQLQLEASKCDPDSAENRDFWFSSCPEMRSTYEEMKLLQEQLRKVPAYNFTKKNKLKKRISVLSNSLDRTILVNMEKQRNEKLREIKKIEADIEIKETDFNGYTNKLSELRTQFNDLTNEITRLNIAATGTMDNTSLPSPELLKSITQNEEVDNYSSVYKKWVDISFARENLDYDLINEKTDNYKSELNWIQSFMTAEKEVQSLTFDALYKNLVKKAITKLFSESDKDKRPKSGYYRYNIYTVLFLCSLYYSTLPEKDILLCIDEAQDLSLCEYMLLHHIQGKNCIFNLYGDVNQLVYSYKGIPDWEMLEDIREFQLYQLNENYRNTNQVTEFCNDELDSEITSIGISGPEVKKMTIVDALNELYIQILSEEGSRAVIYSSNNVTSKKQIQQMGKDICFCPGKVEKGKIALLTVEESKGLEFQTVLVIPENMEYNDLYVAYTRTLNELIIGL